MQFEWDPAKAATNESKHNVSFVEAATVFADELSLTGADPDHSLDEERYVTFGVSSAGRLLVVSHTNRGDGIRIISARPATKKAQLPFSGQRESDDDISDCRHHRMYSHYSVEDGTLPAHAGCHCQVAEKGNAIAYHWPSLDSSWETHHRNPALHKRPAQDAGQSSQD